MVEFKGQACFVKDDDQLGLGALNCQAPASLTTVVPTATIEATSRHYCRSQLACYSVGAWRQSCTNGTCL